MTWVVASAHGFMVPLCQIHSGYCMSVARDSVEQAFCLIAGGGRGGEQEREWGIGNRERQRGSLSVARRADWVAENYTDKPHWQSPFPIPALAPPTATSTNNPIGGAGRTWCARAWSRWTAAARRDRKGVGLGRRWSVRVDHGG